MLSLAFTLRRGVTLVGYSAFYVIRSMHYRDHVFAMNDVIYLDPKERGLDGIGLVVWAERVLAEMKVSKVFYHVKTDAVLGSPAGDSLEAIEEVLEAEEALGLTLRPNQTGADRTLGGVLASIGYGHVENHFGKLLIERKA